MPGKSSYSSSSSSSSSSLSSGRTLAAAAAAVSLTSVVALSVAARQRRRRRCVEGYATVRSKREEGHEHQQEQEQEHDQKQEHSRSSPRSVSSLHDDGSLLPSNKRTTASTSTQTDAEVEVDEKARRKKDLDLPSLQSALPREDNDDDGNDDDGDKDDPSLAPLTLRPIGVVSSVYRLCVGTPRQGLLCPNSRGEIRILESRVASDCVDELDGYTHLWVIFSFHLNSNAGKVAARAGVGKKGLRDRKAGQFPSKISPPALGGTRKVGVFSTRTPHRPNPIGMSLVNIDSVRIGSGADAGAIIQVSGLDLCDGTPVIDIKPYVPHYDAPPMPTPTPMTCPLPQSIAPLHPELGGAGVGTATGVKVPPWVEEGLGLRRTVTFAPEAEDQLRQAVMLRPESAQRNRRGDECGILRFYGVHTGRDSSPDEALDALRSCIIEVLSVDVRSTWQTGKARRGKFQAERAGRVKEVMGAAAKARASEVEQPPPSCTQQLDNLLIRYTVSAPAEKDKRLSEEAAEGSGALDIVVVQAVEWLYEDAESGNDEEKVGVVGEKGTLHSADVGEAEANVKVEAEKGREKEMEESEEKGIEVNNQCLSSLPAATAVTASAAPATLSPLTSASETPEIAISTAADFFQPTTATDDGSVGVGIVATDSIPAPSPAGYGASSNATWDEGGSTGDGVDAESIESFGKEQASEPSASASTRNADGVERVTTTETRTDATAASGVGSEDAPALAVGTADCHGDGEGEDALVAPTDQDFHSLKTYWSSAATRNTPTGLVPSRARKEKQVRYSFSNRRVGLAPSMVGARERAGAVRGEGEGSDADADSDADASTGASDSADAAGESEEEATFSSVGKGESPASPSPPLGDAVTDDESSPIVHDEQLISPTESVVQNDGVDFKSAQSLPISTSLSLLPPPPSNASSITLGVGVGIMDVVDESDEVEDIQQQKDEGSKPDESRVPTPEVDIEGVADNGDRTVYEQANDEKQGHDEKSKPYEDSINVSDEESSSKELKGTPSESSRFSIISGETDENMVANSTGIDDENSALTPHPFDTASTKKDGNVQANIVPTKAIPTV